MHYADRTLIQQSWTLSGRYFGYWEGDDLWSYNGRHIGRLRGAEIFAPDGRYIGEMMGNGRLAVRMRKLGCYGNAYIPWPPRPGEPQLPDQDPGTHRTGFDDFPGPSEFVRSLISAPAFPASIPC
ncbi:MAG TPA: hypothetical protein VGN70_08610 [Gammaproteobacteria bacterium]|jgi:hypothetical protein